MTGGAYRGPATLDRQRRGIRIVQALLVLVAAGLLVFAGFSLGQASGYAAGRRSDQVGAPQPPSQVQSAVLVALGLGALAAAVVLQGGGGVRVPTPARLDELAGRAETAAVAPDDDGNRRASDRVPGASDTGAVSRRPQAR